MFQEISELLGTEGERGRKIRRSTASDCRRRRASYALDVVGLHHPVASGADSFLQSGAGPGHQRDLAVAVTRE